MPATTDHPTTDHTAALNFLTNYWTGTSGPGRERRIAGSPHDQASPPGVDNPMWDLVRLLPAEDIGPYSGDVGPYALSLSPGLDRRADRDALIAFHGLGLTRRSMAQTYAWSIPTPADLACQPRQVGGRGFVEIGAGAGYWACMLGQYGVDVAAYDPWHPDDNHFTAGPEYTTVLRGGYEAAGRHPDRALLLVWPRYAEPDAAHALATYRGDLLLYAGEPEGGCTADDEFFRMLGTEWVEAGESGGHVTWYGIHCHLTAWRRKKAGR